MIIKINGKIDRSIDFVKSVPLNTEVSVVIEKEGFKTYRQDNIFLTEDNSYIVVDVPNLEKLKIAIIYGADAVFIGGKSLAVNNYILNFVFVGNISKIKRAVGIHYRVSHSVLQRFINFRVLD